MISAIIPTWNARRYVPACLMALRSQLSCDDEIILVDNGSRDHVAQWIHRYVPDIRTIVLPHNQGFAGGTNAGLRAARGDMLLLCNDDALVEPGSIAALCHALQLRPDIGAVGGILTFSRQPSIIASAGIKMQRDGVAIDRCIGKLIEHQPSQPYDIFGASGGFALLRRQVLDEVGLFDENFFCYLEDADLAWRIRLQGWHCLLAPMAQARHVYSASGGGFKQRLQARNRLRMMVRCFPTPLLLQCLPFILRYDALAIGYAVLHRQPDIVAGRMAAWHDLPALFEQRRHIQSQRTVPIQALAAWLEPVPSYQEVLNIRQKIAQLVSS